MTRFRPALTALAAATLLGSLLAAPAAHASTKGFEVVNLSHYTMVLTTTETVPQLDGTPKNSEIPLAGLQLAPGQSTRFELDSVGANEVKASWDLLNPDGSTADTAEVYLSLSLFLPSWAASSAKGTLAYTHENGEDVRVLDAPGTVVDSTTLTHDQQWAVINSLCESAEARCAYTIEGQREASFSPQVLDDRNNGTCTPAKQTVTRVTGQDVTNRWEESVTVKGSVLGFFTTAVTERYGEISTSKSDVSSTVDYLAPPHFAFTATLQVPVWTYTGTYLIEAGNTRWALEDVEYETLRDNPSAGSQVDITVRPMTPTELATNGAAGC